MAWMSVVEYWLAGEVSRSVWMLVVVYWLDGEVWRSVMVMVGSALLY
jgi:hypothetical protein